MKRPDSAKIGFVLLNIVWLSAVLLIVIIPLIAWSVNEYAWTVRSFKAMQALNLADAGADLAVWEIAHNNAQFAAWSGGNPKTLTIPSFQDNLGEVIGDITVSVNNTSPGHYFIISTGFVTNAANPTVKKTVKVKVFPHPLFNNAIFGNSSVKMSGNTLADSYNSTIGPYTPLTAGSNADVGTNGTLSLLDNAKIQGDTLIGPNGSISGNDPTNVTGEVFYSGNDVELAEVSLPDDLKYLSNLGNLTVAGKNEVTMPSGNYYYESVSVEGQSTLTISNNTRIYVNTTFYIGGQATVYTQGDVEIYIGGNGNFAGQGIVNATGISGDLEIYGLGSDTSLNFSGLNDFYGVIYAPGSDVSLSGSADYFGSVIADDVALGGNIQFHYDEALSQNGPFSGYDIAYWQED